MRPKLHANKNFQSRIDNTVQLKGSKLTFNQADPTKDTQTVNAEATVDGKTMGEVFKNGKLETKDDRFLVKFSEMWKDGFEKYPIKSGKPEKPHAEDRIIAKYLLTFGGQKKSLLSIRINAAPCGRCARNLRRLKEKEGIQIRVKASFITQKGEAGLPVLSGAQIPFRYWTTEQREQKRVSGNLKLSKPRKSTATEETKQRIENFRLTRIAAASGKIKLAQEYFPNATQSWKAQGLSRAEISKASTSNNTNNSTSQSDFDSNTTTTTTTTTTTSVAKRKLEESSTTPEKKTKRPKPNAPQQVLSKPTISQEAKPKRVTKPKQSRRKPAQQVKKPTPVIVISDDSSDEDMVEAKSVSSKSSYSPEKWKQEKFEEDDDEFLWL